MTELHPEISAICSRADLGLWAAFARSQGREETTSETGKLIFPAYRGGRQRVSEQEARFAFVEALVAGPLTYSVEAPTSKLYQFMGNSPLSAQTDLAIHDEAGNRICNVEFKAMGVSPSAENHLPIFKDIQKLLREPVWGLWFHLLAGVNNATIRNLLSVFTREIDRVRGEFGSDVESPGLTIHVCVLRQTFSIQQDLSLGLEGTLARERLEDLLAVEMRVSRSKLASVRSAGRWKINGPHGCP